jgi:hypothetical protein
MILIRRATRIARHSRVHSSISVSKLIDRRFRRLTLEPMAIKLIFQVCEHCLAFSMQRTIKNWFVDIVDLHLVVRGELWQGDRKLFDNFSTHNPTTVNLDETECAGSTGTRYFLVEKRPNDKAPKLSIVK